MEELLLDYLETFNENFPIFSVKGKSDEEIKKIITDSISSGVPYEPEYNDDYDY